MRVPRAVEIRERPGFSRSQRPFVSPPLSRTFADNFISVGWQHTDISAIRGSRHINSPPSRDFSGCQPPYYPVFTLVPNQLFSGQFSTVRDRFRPYLALFGMASVMKIDKEIKMLQPLRAINSWATKIWKGEGAFC